MNAAVDVHLSIEDIASAFNAVVVTEYATTPLQYAHRLSATASGVPSA